MATVKDILERKGSDVVSVSMDTTVREAAERMAAERIGSVLVMDEDKAVRGIFTERDLLVRVVAAGKSPETTKVSEVMSGPLAACTPGTTLVECQSVMTSRRMRHLLVRDGRHLLGIISSGDILAREIEAQQHTIEYLQEYLHGRV